MTMANETTHPADEGRRTDNCGLPRRDWRLCGRAGRHEAGHARIRANGSLLAMARKNLEALDLKKTPGARGAYMGARPARTPSTALHKLRTPHPEAARRIPGRASGGAAARREVDQTLEALEPAPQDAGLDALTPRSAAIRKGDSDERNR